MISLNDISFSHADRVIFENFNLTLNHHEISGILGPSGIGKTTLINLMAGILPLKKGTLQGIDKGDLSYIFQDPRLLPSETVYGNMAFVLKGHYPDPKACREVILRNLTLVGLEESLDRFPDELSGGMKQRLSIARAFATPSHVLFMDEPFKGLDPGLKAQLMAVFKRSYQATHKTVVFVTHDLDEVLALSDRVFVLGSSPARVVATEIIPREAGSRQPLVDLGNIKTSLLSHMI